MRSIQISAFPFHLPIPSSQLDSQQKNTAIGTYDSITQRPPQGAKEEAKQFLVEYQSQPNHGPGLAYGHHHKSSAGACRDADEDTINAIHIWPFADCKHQDWGYDVKDRCWGRRNLGKEADCYKSYQESTLHKCYRLAVGVLKQECPTVEEQWECEDLAVSMLRIATSEPPKTASDCMFHASALDWLGIMLATREKWKNEHEAVELFKLCSEIYKYPGAFYHYGHALIHGTGGVKKDVQEGIALLNQAGARRIAEAYFELGSIYETGLSGILKDIAKAHDYYSAATSAYMQKRKFEYDVAALKDWYPDFVDLESMLPTESWHTLENDTSSLLGQRFNWCLVGQAFLFSAAASLTNVQPFDHFSPLLWLLPTLGMLIAFFSIFHVIELTARYRRARDPIHAMHGPRSQRIKLSWMKQIGTTFAKTTLKKCKRVLRNIDAMSSSFGV